MRGVPRPHLAAVLLLLILPGVVRAAGDLPAQLSDSEFWQLITDLSEPNGRFQYENFLSNEYNLQWVIPSLKAQIGRGAYIGVGPEQNFTYIAAFQPTIALIIDIRRQNLIEHLMYKAIFELSSDRANFLSLLFSRKRPAGLNTTTSVEELFKSFKNVKADPTAFERNLIRIVDRLTLHHKLPLGDDDRKSIRFVYQTFFQHGPALDYTVGGFYSFDAPPTYEELMTADDGQGVMRSFLATDANFRFVKQLEARNLVVPLVGDFAGPKTVRDLGRYLAAHHVVVTVFYLSNVERYLFAAVDVWRKFYVNVAILPYDAQSVFIRSVFDASYGSSSKLSRIDEIMEAFSEGRITAYADVIALSQ
jgi:hypothetical protein